MRRTIEPARAAVVLWVGLAALLGACGNVADATKAHVRLVNASIDYPQLDLAVDGSLQRTSVGYGTDPGSVDIAPGDAASELRRSGSSAAVLSFTPSLSRDQDYTLLAYGKEGALQTALLDENNSEPDSGKARLRVVNAAADAGAVDVYLTPVGQPLTDASALQANAAFGMLGSFITVDSGTRRLRVTATGSRSDLRLDVSNLVLASRQVATIVITPGSGGVLLQALLITERGTITRADNIQARVRAVAGVAANGSVSASMAGTALLDGAGSPAVGVYRLVNVGASVPLVSVNGVGVPAMSQTLVAGADYTLLVYGPPEAALVAWVDDDNRLPVDATRSRARLVNGVAGLSLSLSVDFAPLAGGVLPGTASAYGTLDPTTTAVLSVNAAGGPSPLAPAVDQSFAAGSTYSYFVLGAPTAASGILRRDR